MSLVRTKRPYGASALAVILFAAGCADDGDAEGQEASSPTSRDAGVTVPSDDGGGERGTTTRANPDTGESCTADRVGGEIEALTGTALSGLDPTLLQGKGARGGDVAAAFYGTVIRYDAATETYEPSIAQSWSANADNTEWSLTLRDDVTFGNGDPFTTEDIKAHLDRLADSSVLAAGMAALVDDVEITSDTEMVAKLESPFDFRYMMASQPGWVPNADLVEKRGDGFHANPTGGGTGAFEFESMSSAPGESLVLQAKDDRWGGTVCLQSIDFRHASEIQTQTDAFLNGEVDTLFVADQEQAAQLAERGLMAYELHVGTLGYVTVNQGFDGEETKFDDVRIRKAMQLAIDYDVLYERLFDGLGPEPSAALLPEGSPLAPGVDGPPYDPEQARQLVQETIDEGVWDGSFTFLHSTVADQRETAVLLEGMWEAVGMEVERESGEDTAARIIVERNFEVATLGFGITPPQPWTSLTGLGCDSATSRSGFCDPEMDAALGQLQEAVGVEEQRAAMGAIQTVWNRTYPLVPYRHGTWGIAAQENVHGLEFGVDAIVRYDDAWVDE